MMKRTLSFFFVSPAAALLCRPGSRARARIQRYKRMLGPPEGCGTRGRLTVIDHLPRRKGRLQLQEDRDFEPLRSYQAIKDSEPLAPFHRKEQMMPRLVLTCCVVICLFQSSRAAAQEGELVHSPVFTSGQDNYHTF